MLKPYRSGYGFDLATGVISTKTKADLPRQRRGQLGQPHELVVTYKCTRAQWQYFLSFFRAHAGRRFLAYLLLDDIDHHWYECCCTDEHINVTTLGDQIFTVKLTLVVKPRRIDIDQDEAIIAIYNMTKDEQDGYFNHLEKLVNQDLPNATRGL